MTQSLLIRGGRIIDPAHNIDEKGNVLVTDGKIAGTGDITPVAGCAVLDAEGLVVCPGFIDLHCHLRQPGFEEKETIATGSRAAARGGFTTICCMPNTNPPLDNRVTVDFVKAEAQANGAVRVLPIGCISKGRQGEELAEMGELASAGVVGYSDDGSPVMNSRLMRLAMEYSRTFGLPIIDHCEDYSLSKDGQMNEGTISAMLGLRGIPSAAEEIIIARDITLARLTGAWLHVAHVSTAESVERIRRTKEQGIKVTAEVTPHHLVLTEEEVCGYNTNTKVNPPLRTRQDILALVQGLNDNTIDAIATDHAPHTEVDKLCEYGYAPFGISGLETALGSLMRLVHEGQLSINTLISRLTCDPARILRRDDIGELSNYAIADITVFDTDKDWVVDTNNFASKGRNTPLAGSVLRGKVMATISGGKPVYIDDTVKIEEKIA